MKNLKLFGILLICGLCFNLSYAQAPKVDKKTAKANEKAAKADAVKRLITSGNYVFKATYAIPIGMTSRALNADYDVTVTKDKVDIYLPYFGRAYAAPRDLNDGGIKLKSTKFDYTAITKKSGWEITIKPKDSTTPGVKDVQAAILDVNADGYASLRVTSLNRQPISFNGYVEEIKKEK